MWATFPDSLELTPKPTLSMSSILTYAKWWKCFWKLASQCLKESLSEL